MKEFDYEKAKAGVPVCTRDGRPARIICWDRKGAQYPIIVLAERNGVEVVSSTTDRGHIFADGRRSNGDLFMAPVKHEGWVLIVPEGPHCIGHIYDTKEEAEEDAEREMIDYSAIAHIEYEE